MAKDKKPDKNNGSRKGSVSCERTCFSDRCSRIANQETRQSPPSSPSMIRLIDLPSRHQRRGAVREKRTVSLDRPRPAHQRADNAYVDTPFVDSSVPLQLQGAPTASCSSTPHGVSYSSEGCVTDANKVGLPAITFRGMISSAEPPPRPGEGIIDEFPAYVPWRAEQPAQEDTLECTVCHKCRCANCQKLCMYPGMRVCGVLDVQSRCDEACVETTTVCLPCFQKTARCPASNLARAEARAVRAQAATAAATDANDNGGEPRTARVESDKCRLRWLMCCFCIPCPCCTVDSSAECSTGCRGNVNVSDCECVDWLALKRNNRRRVNIAAAAVAAARDRRRCRDYHYYITTMSHSANNTTAAAGGANGENVNTSRLRRFLRF